MHYTPDVPLFLGCALLLVALCRLLHLSHRRRRLADATDKYTFAASDVGRWRAHLDAEGFVVLRDVLSPAECDTAIGLLWSWFEGLGSGIKRDEPSTWTTEAWPGHQLFGFLQTHGGGQSEGAWYVRSHPRVKAAFAAIWGTADLIASLDTPIAWRPWWLDRSWLPRVERLHCDQNPFTKPGRHCVQGMVPLLGQDRAVGGLQVVPRTHTEEVQQQLKERYPHLARNGGDDWCELAATDPHIGTATLLECAPGALILWDSRLIHGGHVGPGRAAPSQETTRGASDGAGGGAASAAPPTLARLSCTVCMTAKSRAKPAVLDQRREAVAYGHTLTHWPHQYTPHTLPDTGGEAIRRAYKAPKLREEQWDLVA